MSKSHFKVRDSLDGAGGAREGTVTIDRDAGLFHVRPLRRHRVYTLPLAMVATMVCRMIVAAEVREKKRAKKLARKKR